MSTENLAALKIIEKRNSRIYISLAVALLVFLLTKSRSTVVICLVSTWIAFATMLLVLAWAVILSMHPQNVKANAEKEDSSSSVIFFIVLIAAFASLFAIIFLLQSIPDESKKGLSLHVILAIASIFSSWTLIHTIFTLRYAHMYYIAENQNASTGKDDVPGLAFPEEDNPDYLDFAYFSFVLGMTFQVSDVEINSKKIRRLALLHSVLSFVYNTVIVALSINIISGLIPK